MNTLKKYKTPDFYPYLINQDAEVIRKNDNQYLATIEFDQDTKKVRLFNESLGYLTNNQQWTTDISQSLTFDVLGECKVWLNENEFVQNYQNEKDNEQLIYFNQFTVTESNVDAIGDTTNTGSRDIVKATEDSTNSITPTEQKLSQELKASGIDLIFSSLFKVVNSTADLPDLPDLPNLSGLQDLPQFRSKYCDFSIREIRHETWITKGKKGRVKQLKTESRYIVEYKGHYLTKKLEWTTNPQDPDILLFVYIKEAKELLHKYFYDENELHQKILYGENVTKDDWLQYAHLSHGGWYSLISRPDGNLSQWCQVKPFSPRLETIKNKAIKYESPKGENLEIILPFINDQKILSHICKQLNKRYNTNFEATNFNTYLELFTVAKLLIPVYITEGYKKVISLLSNGYLAIGLSGIWCFSQKEIGNNHNPTVSDSHTKVLHPTLKLLLTNSKKTIIAFDSDVKESTQIKVLSASLAFKKSLNKYAQIEQYNIDIIKWDNQKGKGVDDLLANGYTLENDTTKYIGHWYKNLTKLTPDETIETKYLSEYLEKAKIPAGKTILGIKSRQGTGKTYAISNKISTGIRQGEAYAINITHRESLGRINASNFGIGYRTDNDLVVSGNLGLTLCADSFLLDKPLFGGKTLPEFLTFLTENEKKTYVILDEIHQLLDHIYNSKTEIKKYRDKVLESFNLLINHCFSSNNAELILLDADLCDTDLKILADIAMIPYNIFREKCQIIQNNYNDDLWNYTIYSDSYDQDGKVTISGINKWNFNLENTLREKLANGDKRPIYVVTTAQKSQSNNGTTILEKSLEKIAPERILRIDSETLSDLIGGKISEAAKFRNALESSSSSNFGENQKEFLQNFLAKYDVIVVSPSLETGISIPADLQCYAIFAYFGGNTPINNFIQSLCRVRYECHRYIYIKDSCFNNPDRGIGLTARQKEESLIKNNSEVFKLLINAKYEIIEQTKSDLNINLTSHWAKLNEITDVGLFDAKENIKMLLDNMGCQEHPDSYSDDFYLNKDNFNKIVSINKAKKITKQVINYNDAVDITNAEKLETNDYLQLKNQKTWEHHQKIAIKRYEYAEKFSSQLLSDDNSYNGVYALMWENTISIYEKLKLEIILRDKQKAYDLDYLNYQKNDYEKSNYSQLFNLFKILGIFSIIDSNELISPDNPTIVEALEKWSKYYDHVYQITGLKLRKDYEKFPVKAINPLLKMVGYKFKVAYKNNTIYKYKIIRNVYKERISPDELALGIYPPDRMSKHGFEYCTPDELKTVTSHIANQLENSIRERMMATIRPSSDDSGNYSG